MTTQEISIKLLNHACVTITAGSVKLLCDPWLGGTCFKGGWGLKYENPNAWEDVSQATHMWISHFHGDHFHPASLKKILEGNPNIRALGNVSPNADLKRALHRMGFKNVLGLSERKWVELKSGFSVIRYPATGIDSMMVVDIQGFRILNFNDCNLPIAGIRSLMRKLGSIDVLLTNFNHANKLVDVLPDDEIKRSLIDRFERIIEAINPKTVIPFASMHYYRALGSQNQNSSLLEPEELPSIGGKVRALKMGDVLKFEANHAPILKKQDPPIPAAAHTLKTYTESIPYDILVGRLQKYCIILRREYLGLVAWIPALLIYVTDHDKYLSLSIKYGVTLDRTGAKPDIEMHSSALSDWVHTPYGTDTLFVGADFKIPGSNSKALDRMILAGVLYNSGLSFKQVIRMLVTPAGWGFFWNRREEILAVLKSGHIAAGNRT